MYSNIDKYNLQPTTPHKVAHRNTNAYLYIYIYIYRNYVFS